MIHIDWMTAAFVAFSVGVALLSLRASRKTEREWVAAVKDAVGGELAAPRRVRAAWKETSFELTYAPTGGGGETSEPRWQVFVPEIRGPGFVARKQSRSDQKMRQWGTEKEATLPDAGLDDRLWVGTPDPEAVTRLFTAPGLAGALGAIWPLSENREDGEVAWVHLGDGLTALIDTSKVSSAHFDEQVARLARRVVDLGVALRAAPEVPSSAPPIPVEHVDGNTLHRKLTLLSFCLGAAVLALPPLMMATGLPLARGWNGSLALALVAGLAGLALALRFRGTPSFRHNLWNAPMFAVAGFVLGSFVPVLNGIPDAAAQEGEVKVTRSEPFGWGPVELWKVELEALGTFALPFDSGATLPEGAVVHARWRPGILGQPRLIELRAPAQAAAAAD